MTVGAIRIERIHFENDFGKMFGRGAREVTMHPLEWQEIQKNKTGFDGTTHDTVCGLKVKLDPDFPVGRVLVW